MGRLVLWSDVMKKPVMEKQLKTHELNPSVQNMETILVHTDSILKTIEVLGNLFLGINCITYVLQHIFTDQKVIVDVCECCVFIYIYI